MRIILMFIVTVFVTALKAQIPLVGNFQNNTFGNTFVRNYPVFDSSTQKKWFINTYSGVTAGHTFFSHGGAGFVAVPAGLQLTHRLNNNVYAFAGVAVAPMYVNFNHAFVNTDLNNVKTGRSFYQPGNIAMYSAATMGLMYINNQRTFSVSGSISVERSSSPLYYNNQLNTTKPNTAVRSYR